MMPATHTRPPVRYPSRAARQSAITFALVEHGINLQKSARIAHYVPDFLLLQILREPQNIFLDILPNGACYVRRDDEVYFVGLCHLELNGGLRAGHRWTDFSFELLSDEQLARLSVDEVLSTYEPTKWQTELQWYREKEPKITLNLIEAFENYFTGTTDENVIH